MSTLNDVRTLTIREAIRDEIRARDAMLEQIETFVQAVRASGRVLLTCPTVGFYDVLADGSVFESFAQNIRVLANLSYREPSEQKMDDAIADLIDEIVKKELTTSAGEPDVLDLPIASVRRWLDAIPQGQTADLSGITAPPGLATMEA